MSDLDKINLLRSFIRHREYVGDALNRVADALRQRARVHDLSKLTDEEFEGFSRINAVAREQKFGSEEYKESMRREREVIDTHFKRNTHHPEYTEMNFMDVIEMVCDWYGARLGYDDKRSWQEGFALAMESKGEHLNEHQRWLARQVAECLEPNP